MEPLKSLMVVEIAHHLKFLSLAFQIIKDKILSLNSNVGYSGSDWCLFFEEFIFLADRFILCNKIWNGYFNIKFVRIRIGLRRFLELVDNFRSVFKVLGWVKNLLFLGLFLLGLLFAFLFYFFFGLFSSVLGGFFFCQFFLFFKSFLLIFTKLFLAFSLHFSLLRLSLSVLDFILGLLVLRFFFLSWIFLHNDIKENMFKSDKLVIKWRKVNINLIKWYCMS
jgi:hypothetical protein